MKIREYQPSDLARIEQLHRESGLDYVLPPMDEFFSKKVIEDDSGIGMAALQRLSSEMYLLCDHSWRNPAWRLESIRQLQRACSFEAKLAGVQEFMSFLPPTVEKKFSKRLTELGWSACRPDWHCYFKKIF